MDTVTRVKARVLDYYVGQHLGVLRASKPYHAGRISDVERLAFGRMRVYVGGRVLTMRGDDAVLVSR